MQYVWTQGTSTKGPILGQEELVFIDLDAFRTLQIDGVLIADGNAAAEDTNFYCAPFNLSVLDWKIIETRNCYYKEYKRRKAAEVLVPDFVSVAYFSRVVVCSNKAADRLRRIVKRFTKRLRISVDPNYYY
jgi:hypothetical protein